MPKATQAGKRIPTQGLKADMLNSESHSIPRVYFVPGISSCRELCIPPTLKLVPRTPHQWSSQVFVAVKVLTPQQKVMVAFGWALVLSWGGLFIKVNLNLSTSGLSFRASMSLETAL